MRTKRFGWVRIDPYARREAKTRQKETQMSEYRVFCNACTHQKKQYVGRDAHRGREGTTVRNLGGERGAQHVMNVCTQVEHIKTSDGVKKNEIEQTQIYVDR